MWYSVQTGDTHTGDVVWDTLILVSPFKSDLITAPFQSIVRKTLTMTHYITLTQCPSMTVNNTRIVKPKQQNGIQPLLI